MPEIQFEVTTDLATVSNTQIETNFEAVRDWLTEELAPYATMVVSPDAIADAKKTRASLNKVKDSIDSQRKAIKKVWMKPYEEYEAKCKELTGIVGEAVGNIDGQIKSMENEMKEQKRQRLSDLFDDNSYVVADYITFDDIFDSKWLNSSFSEIEAANIMVGKIEEFKEGLEAIRGMNSPYEASMLSEYSKTHSVSKAIAMGKQLEAIQKAEEERKAREAEQQFSEPEVSEEPSPEPSAPPVQATAQFIRPVAEEEPPKPKTYTLRFEVELTKEQAYDLKYFFARNNIKYYKL
ncbi:MAG: DUF1351 domain-containing protein [Clostridia bacterium]|nr:DUF1351 domain-containing protein [Clostridia bacterium]